MRNLICLGRTRTVLVSRQSGDLPVTAIAPIPSSENAFFVAHGPISTNHKIEILRVEDGKSTPLASWPTSSSGPDETETIIDFRFLSNSATLCCILSGGDIVLVKVETEVFEERFEIIGNVEGGVLAAEWAVDEEVLAVASGRSKLLFMTPAFEILSEILLSPKDISQHINQVSVGWGRAETQFRGLRAKNAPRDPTLPEKVDQGTPSPYDDNKVRINWRGDGECLALSRMEHSDSHSPSKRVVRVYTRDGQIESFSEPIDGLEGVLSWRPSGNWIATVKRTSEEDVEVVFLERNGLRHGGFKLRKPGVKIRELAWNSDSSVLAVLLEDRIQLWMVGNYYWMLKQEIVMIRENNDESFEATWHPEKPFILFTNTADAVERYEYVLDLCKDSSSPPFDYGLVAILDGESLKLTPLRIYNIPPPMAASELSIPSTPSHVSFDSTGKNFAILRQRHVDIVTWTEFNTIRVANPHIIKTLSLEKFFESNDFVRQIVLIDRDLLGILADDSHSSSIIKILRQNDNSEFEEVHCTKGIGMIIRLFPQYSGGHLLFETTDGMIHDLGDPTSPHLISASAMTRFSTRCYWIRFANVENHDIVFGLTANGKLYANNRLLSPFVNNRLLTSSCTSFQLTPTHLIFTTQSVLKIVLLCPSIEELDIPTDDLNDERTRPIERGSKIVTIMPSVHAVVLQAPRGNLETVSPRALVLASVRQSIAKKEFRTAFLTCRSHRIDMNILHNHQPELFMTNIPFFIQQLRDVEYIDLFLSSLKYSSLIVQAECRESSPTNVDGSKATSVLKVSIICDAILAELLAQYPTTHTQSILTAHLSKIPPDIPAALRLIAQLKDNNSKLVRSAIEHICFLADVNRLYDEALGLYRLDIALLIAQKSQKDPREYLPFLRSLNEMDTELSRFTIDDYLKRYTKALEYLSQCEPKKTFDDVLAYVKKHQLHKEAMRLYKDQRDQYDAILDYYGDYLAENNQPAEAGLAFELVGQKPKAIESYTKAGLWRECLNIAYSIPMPAKDLAELATQLAESLVERRQFVDAARLYIDYGTSDTAIVKAVNALAKGYHFTEAIRVVNDKHGPEKIATIVHPTIIECFSETTELISELRGQLSAQVPRLRILREKKAENPENYFEGNTNNDIDAPDDISVVGTEATTSASLFTRYTPQSSGSRGTQTSSKNRRREERKRARGKKGTIYEEEYLVNSIGRLIQRVQDIREEVMRLITALMMIDKRLEAGEIQKKFEKLVEEIRGRVVEVFAEPVPASRVSGEGENVVSQVPVLEAFMGSEFLA